MRRLFLCVIFCINVFFMFAETPQGISYQAVIRDANGQLLPSTEVGVKASILQGKGGASVYSEERKVTTNENGLLTFVIGETAPHSLSDIDWSQGEYYIQCEFDLTGGDHYTLTLTNQVMSVPYALYAERISSRALPAWVDPDRKPEYTFDEIVDAPRVPQKMSDLANDMDFVSQQDLPSTTGLLSEVEADGKYQPKGEYLTEHQSLEAYAKKSDLPSLTGLLSAAEAEVKYQPKGEYLTEHQSLADYAKKTDLPSTTGLLSEAEADGKYQPKGEYLTEHQSLAAYLTAEELKSMVHDSLADYAKKSDLPAADSLLSKVEAESNYAKKSDVPSLTGLLSEAEADDKYQPKGEYLTEHQSLADYAKKADLPAADSLLSKVEAESNYAKKSDLPSLTGLLSEAEADGKYQPKGDYLTEHQSLEAYAKKTDLPSTVGLLSEAEAEGKYQPKGEYLTEHQSLAAYLTSEESKSMVHDSLADYAKKSDVPSLTGLLSEVEADDKYQPKGEYLTEHQSLEAYAKKSDLPSLTGLLSAVEADDKYQPKGNYLTEHQPLADYAKKADLPDVTGLLSEVEADGKYQPKGEYLTEHQSLEAYAKKSDLPSTTGLLSEAEAEDKYQPKGEYLTEHQSLEAYAKKSDLPSLTGLLSEVEADDKYQPKGNYLTEHQPLADYAKKADLPDVTGLLSAVEADGKYQPKGEYLTEHQSLEAYAKKTDVPTVPTQVSAFENDAAYVTSSQLTEMLASIQNQISSLMTENKALKAQVDSLSAVIRLIHNPSVASWSEDFSDGVGNVTNDENGWYELQAVDGRLRAVLREPDYSQNVASFAIATSQPLDLSKGAYLSLSVQGVQSEPGGRVVADAGWNNNNSLSVRLKDANGGVSNWVPLNKSGIATSDNGAFDANRVTLENLNIGSFLDAESFDRSNVVAIEMTLIGWLGIKQLEYRPRNKGVYIGDLRLSDQESEDNGSAKDTDEDDNDLTYKRAAANSYSYSTTDWNYGPDLYHNLKQGDRIIYVCRHSERDENCSGRECDLNVNGVNLAQNVGRNYTGGPAAANASYFYGSTDYPRCTSTSYWIAQYRGDNAVTSKEMVDSGTEVMNLINGSYFTDCDKWPSNAELYETYPKEVNRRALRMIDGLCAMTEGKTFSWFTSHDFLTVVLTEWATKRGDFYNINSTWINFMSGIAVIVHPDKTWEVYPVRNLDNGYLYRYYGNWGRCETIVVKSNE